METLRGYVDKITFRNEENGYTVLTLNASGEEECLVGTMPPLSEGEFIEADGERTLLFLQLVYVDAQQVPAS